MLEAERRAASIPVFAEGASTVRFATPVDEVATVADFHSPDMSLGASAGNMSLKTRTAGQTMVINARRRLGMKTTPQPVVDTAAKAEAKSVSRPTRRMRSKGPLQQEDLQKAPNPGGEPPHGPAGGDPLAAQDARGSGGVLNPPGLPVRHNPGGPPGAQEMIMEEEMTRMNQGITRLFIRMMQRDPLASQMVIRIQMVLMIVLLGCTSL